MPEPPVPPPEAGVLRMARIVQQLSVHEAAQRAGVSASLWRQVEAGYTTPAKGVQTPKVAPAATLARMAWAVDLQAERLESQGQRPDAAEILGEIIRQQGDSRIAPPKPRPDRDFAREDAARIPEEIRHRESTPLPEMTPELKAAMQPHLAEIQARVEVASQANPAERLTGSAIFPLSPGNVERWDTMRGLGFSVAQVTTLMAVLWASDVERRGSSEGTASRRA